VNNIKSKYSDPLLFDTLIPAFSRGGEGDIERVSEYLPLK